MLIILSVPVDREELIRTHSVQWAVSSDAVVLLASVFDDDLGFGQCPEWALGPNVTRKKKLTAVGLIVGT